MRIIKLNAIDSTNSYLRQLLTEKNLEDFTIVIAEHQTNGRGQMGTIWKSEKEKNLTISIYKDLNAINLQEKFDISIAVSLAICKALKDLNVSNLKIKWPNDILADNKKIGGILIENIIKKGKISASIIGIGLNLNQTKFDDLPQASSLRLLTGKVFDKEEVLHHVAQNLQDYFKKLKTKNSTILRPEYIKKLFRLNKPSTFQNKEGKRFSAYIKDISEDGKLVLLLEDEIEQKFDFKEVTLMY